MASSLLLDDAEKVLNAKLKPHLHSIHASLKLDNDATTANVAILKTLLDGICEMMKRKDPLFRLLFNRRTYTGSFYDGLRIKRADEFDINLVLDLPFRDEEVTVLQGRPGHVGYEVSPAAVNRLRQKRGTEAPLLQWMDSQHRLLPDRVKRWLQSVVDRTLQYYHAPEARCRAVAEIRSSESGPAKTFHIILKDGRKIDVDLVPVIEFRHPSWPDGIEEKEWMSSIPKEDHNWLLVPKPRKEEPHLWRLHFPNMEKRLITDFGCVKPIIRLLKTTRDSYNWNLSSYALKTFVMSQLLENYNEQYWHPRNEGILFVRV
ncbi:unnamed protein product, partial [Ixodes hexagonus]